MALPNLPSLPHINVMGAVVTGTHGSGIYNTAMATYVHKIAFVDAGGNKRVLTRGDKDFLSYLHSFGTLGIVYELTMDIVEEYAVRKCVYQNVPWDSIFPIRTFDKINGDTDYVSYFTDWK